MLIVMKFGGTSVGSAKLKLTRISHNRVCGGTAPLNVELLVAKDLL